VRVGATVATDAALASFQHAVEVALAAGQRAMRSSPASRR
jgi:hypothetical protein